MKFDYTGKINIPQMNQGADKMYTYTTTLILIVHIKVAIDFKNAHSQVRMSLSLGKTSSRRSSQRLNYVQ